MTSAEDRIAEALALIGQNGYDHLVTINGVRAILSPPKERITIGGIVFEKGERRVPKAGEWYYICGGTASVNGWDTEDTDFLILTPVGLVEND